MAKRNALDLSQFDAGTSTELADGASPITSIIAEADARPVRRRRASGDQPAQNEWMTRALVWRFISGDSIPDIAENWSVEPSDVETALRNALRAIENEE